MEPNDCRLWTEPHHFKYTLPSANMCIYLNRSAYPRNCCEETKWFRIQASEFSLISSNILCRVPTCVNLNRSAYPCNCCEERNWFRIQASEFSLISSKIFTLPPVHLSTCVCHYLWQEWLFRLYTFIFLRRTNPWVKYPRNSIFFLNFKRMFY